MCVFIRVLIRGSGTLGCTKIDHRANSPAFRMTGNAVVAGIEIDMTGFRESILVSGDAQCQPIFLKCIVRCSGDDAVNLTGQCKPLFHACTIEVCKLLLRYSPLQKGLKMIVDVRCMGIGPEMWG